ncbi:MAG: CAP domain-containing protein [Bacteroidia bacterium]|nr:CAP domain-containing protein [Bacteroidia bacterium]
MKKPKKILLVIFILSFGRGTGVYAQLYTLSKLPELHQLAKTDSIEKINFCASQIFHQLINSYRRRFNQDTLAWDDLLWLTCRNHNTWQHENGVLSHHEKPGTPFFCGENPRDRYLFTTNQQGKHQWSGENTLYNYSRSGKTILEIATTMANYAFKQWAESPGHNINMLSSTHKVHGTAFTLSSGGRVYATDLFASNRVGNIPTKFFATQVQTHSAIDTLGLVQHKQQKNCKPNLKQLDTDLTNQLYALHTNSKSPNVTAKNKALEKASEKHAAYMSHRKILSHNETKNNQNFFAETFEKRVIKSSHGWFYLKQRKYILSEEITYLEATSGDVDMNKLAVTIQQKLDEQYNVQDPKTKLGYGISLKRSKNKLCIYVTRLSLSKRI